MIKELRKNFILVAMCSTFIVLMIIVGTLNIVSYKNMESKADKILEILVENNAIFPQEMPNPNFIQKDVSLPPPFSENTVMTNVTV